MEEVKCINCNNIIKIKKLIKGTTIACKCGCIQKCLDVDEYISRWRVINPFSIEDKR